MRPSDPGRASRNYGHAQTLVLSLFALTFVLDPNRPLALSPPLALAGTVLCAIGLLIMLAAFLSIRGVIQIAPEPKADGRLITGGIYGWLRHPIYTAIIVLVLGLFLRKPTIAIGIAAVVVVVFLMVKARFEQVLLRARYPEYADYQRRTWGIIPGLRW
jgi:protein-S-isoprenylcysteine O-methyltransferase Ste14